MPKAKTRRAGLSDPTRLPVFDPDDKSYVVVIVETPKGSRNKYAYSEAERVFSLTKVLPAGMDFPYDFGFVPSTRAGDGDPLDVLVLMDEPAFPGCRLSCRPIGVILGEQGKKKHAVRNDRLVCVEKGNHSYAHLRHIDDMGPKFEKELEEFFVNYHQLSGSKYRIIAMKGPGEALRCIKACRRAARAAH